MNATELTQYISEDQLQDTFERLYPNKTHHAKERYLNSMVQFKQHFGANRQISIFSAPGRTEVGGNHTDHQHGRVLAGSIDLDIIAVASKNNTNTVKIYSQGYGFSEICLDDLSIQEDECNTTQSLMRGIAYKIQALGYKLNGFDAYITSDVLSGSGLSSSAAFEVLLATIINHFYCDNKLSTIEIAIISQYAENNYFGKPCGLMDQTACAIGGFVMIDFKNTLCPVVEQIDFDLPKHGYQLFIVNTGSSHADLTDDYANIPQEMKLIANYFNKEYLRDVNEKQFFSELATLRFKVSHRAILRAIHFFNENNRVVNQAESLQQDDISTFIKLVNASGTSSNEYLQNSFSVNNPKQQGILLALCITRQFYKKSACRVHGGGFAGTIQAYIPNEQSTEYIKLMESVFGENCCYPLTIRKEGSILVI